MRGLSTRWSSPSSDAPRERVDAEAASLRDGDSRPLRLPGPWRQGRRVLAVGEALQHVEVSLEGLRPLRHI